MIEVRTGPEFKNFLDNFEGQYPKDNFISNFLHAYHNVGVGCRCKRKAKIKAAEARHGEALRNLTEEFKKTVAEKHKEETVNFYYENALVLSINNE